MYLLIYLLYLSQEVKMRCCLSLKRKTQRPNIKQSGQLLPYSTVKPRPKRQNFKGSDQKPFSQPLPLPHAD